MSVYIINFSQALKKCLIMISTKHCITATIEDNVINITYVGEQEIHRVLTYHCATYSLWPRLLFIGLYLALSAKSLDTPALNDRRCSR